MSGARSTWRRNPADSRRSKRPAAVSGQTAQLPGPLAEQWRFLLEHLSSALPGFSTALQYALLARISDGQGEKGTGSYARTVCAWLLHLVEAEARSQRGSDAHDDQAARMARRCLQRPSPTCVPAVQRRLAHADSTRAQLSGSS